jgi:molecular chaperone DnaK
MGRSIGIDLGTTNSCRAYSDGTEVHVIHTGEGSRIMPSVVAFTHRGERLVGLVAKRQAITNPRNTVCSVKRLMGRKYSELSDDIRANATYEIIENEQGDAIIRIMEHDYTPPEISAIILRKLKESAEEFFGEEVTEAVITVPAYFNEVQREATKAAGRIAGFNVQRVLNEPTAAALAFIKPQETNNIAVYDFGGGTFDISILKVVNGIFEVKATCGDTQLGGDDFDVRVVEWILNEFQREKGIDLSKDPVAPQRVREAAERAKCELSQALEARINLPFIASGGQGPVHLELSITRKLLENLIRDLIEKTRALCETALKDSGIGKQDINHVILVGGSTRIPLVRQLVEDVFKQKPAQFVNPDEVVAVGAAVEASVLSGARKDLVLIDVTPLTLGVETLGGVMASIVEKNTPIPIKRSRMFTTATDNQAAVSVHVLQGEREFADGNRSLSRFELVGIPPARRGEPRISVTFEIDANGILNVSARDAVTGREQSIEVNPTGGLTDSDILKLMQEAEASAQEDRERMRLVEERNRADVIIYEATKVLKAAREQLEKESWEELEASLANLRRVRDDTDIRAIGTEASRTDTLTNSVSKLIAVMESHAEDEEEVDQVVVIEGDPLVEPIDEVPPD